MSWIWSSFTTLAWLNAGHSPLELHPAPEVRPLRRKRLTRRICPLLRRRRYSRLQWFDIKAGCRARRLPLQGNTAEPKFGWARSTSCKTGSRAAASEAGHLYTIPQGNLLGESLRTCLATVASANILIAYTVGYVWSTDNVWRVLK